MNSKLRITRDYKIYINETTIYNFCSRILVLSHTITNSTDYAFLVYMLTRLLQYSNAEIYFNVLLCQFKSGLQTMELLIL